MEVFNHLIFEVVEKIALVSLNRPARHNALDFATIEELKSVFKTVNVMQDIKVIILRGIGRDFCAGLDFEYIQELQKYDLEANIFDSENTYSLFALMQQIRQPIITRAHGLCLSSGCGLILASDICFAHPQTIFGFRDVKLGLIPANMALLLGNKIGMNRAKYLLLTGDTLSPDEAWALGIIHRVIPESQLDDAVFHLAIRMCRENATEAMELTKRLFADLPHLPASDQIQLANRMNAHGKLGLEGKFGVQNIRNNTPFEWN